MHASVKIFDKIADAPIYLEPEFVGVDITDFMLVKKGTVSGKTTVDIILKDKNGQKYAALITGDILRAVVASVNGSEHN